MIEEDGTARWSHLHLGMKLQDDVAEATFYKRLEPNSTFTNVMRLLPLGYFDVFGFGEQVRYALSKFGWTKAALPVFGGLTARQSYLVWFHVPITSRSAAPDADIPFVLSETASND